MLDLKKHSSNDSIETPATFDDRISTVISSTLSFSPSLSRRGCWECRSVERILLREISDRRSEISRGGMCSSDKERRNGVFLFARPFFLSRATRVPTALPSLARDAARCFETKRVPALCPQTRPIYLACYVSKLNPLRSTVLSEETSYLYPS